MSSFDDPERRMASPYKDPKRRSDYQREYHKNIWYPAHRQDRIDRSRRKREELVEWYREYKKTLKCADCGQTHPATLEFHHLDPAKKEVNISRLIATSSSLRRLKEEMAKCIVLCANCHRIRHWNERYGEDDLL